MSKKHFEARKSRRKLNLRIKKWQLFRRKKQYFASLIESRYFEYAFQLQILAPLIMQSSVYMRKLRSYKFLYFLPYNLIGPALPDRAFLIRLFVMYMHEHAF